LLVNDLDRFDISGESTNNYTANQNKEKNKSQLEHYDYYNEPPPEHNLLKGSAVAGRVRSTRQTFTFPHFLQ
jgi:hypothetical protein